MESYTIKNLTFSYPEQKKKALANLSVSIEQGQFVTLCGPSGCGKTTLLRQLKPALSPHGEKSGEVWFENMQLTDLDQHSQSAKIGFVLQNPDSQIVTDKVWHELAFGLESLGFDTPTIRLRVAEMASFFGIQTWFYQNVTALSGGQKQLLNLASIMVMQPSVLILDEPTSQLDPIAAADFLSTVAKINRELGVTVIITEHRLEEVFAISHRVLVMDEGQLICDGTPKEVGENLKSLHHSMFFAMPTPMRVYAGVENDLPCPVTVREGRVWLEDFCQKRSLNAPIEQKPPAHDQKGTAALELNEVWFRYEKDGPDVVKGLSLRVFPGEFYAIVGGNGTGKTTALSLICGINRPYRGSVKINSQESSQIGGQQLFHRLLGVLPQNPQALFVKKTVQKDLMEMLSGQNLSKAEKERKIHSISQLCCLGHLLDRHPYDLSGGEQQRAALAKVLLLEPKILLLDEPTKGMDHGFKQTFAAILRDLLRQRITIVMVSHDVEFCAAYADQCALFFDGSIVSADVPRRFFTGNNFYTTAANRMAKPRIPQAVIANDIIMACGGDVQRLNQISPESNSPSRTTIYKTIEEEADDKGVNGQPPTETNLSAQPKKKFSHKRKIAELSVTAIFIATIVGAVIFVARQMNIITGLLSGGDLAVKIAADPHIIRRYVLLILTLVTEFLVLLFTFSRKNTEVTQISEQVAPENRRLSKRTLSAMIMILVAIPLTIYIGVYYLGDRKYYFISMLIILETMLPFILVFENRKPQARELIVISVLCALGVAGRAAFFMLPQFKPVVAIVIIAGVAFGGESGFLVGAVTGFVSNIFFGQGPWTPWQMFAFGIIGFLAGVLFRKGILRRNRVALSIFGGLSTFFIYGGIMNSASVFMFQARPVKEMFYLAYIQGIPFDLVHAAATITFLWLISRPMLEKLDRIKTKYGLVEP